MRGDLRVVQGGAAPVPPVVADPGRFQEDCAQAYAASWVARGFSQVTVDSATSRLERVLATFAKPAWEVTREDVDRVVGSWAAAGIAASTRRTYLQAFKGFHEFLTARKASEIEAVFGVRLESPLDEFNAARHVACDRRPRRRRRRRSGWRSSSSSCGDGSPPRASSARPGGIMRCTGRCITRACGRRRRPRWSCRTYISDGARSARSTSGSARAPRPRGRGRGGCRCWTGWT